MKVIRWAGLVAALLFVTGCSSLYYGMMEKVGVQKRDIMTSRVKDARDAQAGASEQFQDSLAQFKQVVKIKGGDLQKEYDRLNATLQKSEARANEVHERIAAVEHVSKALFKEWKAEIKQYSNESLRASSQRKYDATFASYQELMAAMKKAEARLEPVLVPMRDQVMYLKHNLNARAIAGLSDELISVEAGVDSLVAEMARAVAKADAFIATLEP